MCVYMHVLTSSAQYRSEDPLSRVQHVQIYVCIYPRVCACVYVKFMYTYMNISMYIYIHVCVCVCVCIYSLAVLVTGQQALF